MRTTEVQVREFKESDLSQIKEIRDKYHPDIVIPSFDHFIGKYTVECDGKIIVFGGVRMILEAIAITDMSQSVRNRREALYKLFQANLFTANVYKYDQIHCFPLTGEKWTKHLIEKGFHFCKGDSLVFNLGD